VKCEKCGYDDHGTGDTAHHCGPLTQTCTMPRDMRPVSVETLKQAMQEIDMLPKLDQWIVMDPQGRMYKGTVEQMTRLLVQYHPLMRTPFELIGADHAG
jgi:hypothetical protein